MTIKITALTKPTKKFIKLWCPECKQPIGRVIPINRTEGKDLCNECGTEFKWEEE